MLSGGMKKTLDTYVDDCCGSKLSSGVAIDQMLDMVSSLALMVLIIASNSADRGGFLAR